MLEKYYCYRSCGFGGDPCEHPECEALREDAAVEAERKRPTPTKDSSHG